jgi:hypothetical protein
MNVPRSSAQGPGLLPDTSLSCLEQMQTISFLPNIAPLSCCNELTSDYAMYVVLVHPEGVLQVTCHIWTQRVRYLVKIQSSKAEMICDITKQAKESSRHANVGWTTQTASTALLTPWVTSRRSLLG